MKKYLLAALVLVLAVLAIVYGRRSATSALSVEQSQPVTATPTGDVPAATVSENKVPAAPSTEKSVSQPSSAKLPYAEAVKRYGAQRVQFNGQCQATPTGNIYKVGLELMLDNRADVERLINFSGKAYRIPAYDYTVVKLTTPGIIYVDCGSSQNVAKITVQ
ncbi:MAG: hypothetical protein JNK33_02805 [Candidatus Doudnabacteria bacterium]|nr:hypothetical protein [Candidatus Doudnabacteria bacterium]